MLVPETNSNHNVSDSPPTTTTNSVSTMLTNGSNQYIQPDYLSPLSTTLDAKRSPLALLAQTCSQIGADPLPATTSTPSATSSSSSVSTVNKPTVAAEKSAKKSSDSTASTNENKSRKTPPSSSKSSVFDPYSRRDDKTDQADMSHHKSGFKSPTSVNKSSHSSSSATSPTTTSAAATSYPSSLATEAKLTESHRAALEAAMQQQSHLSKDIQSLGAYRPSPVFPSLSGLSGLSPYHHPGLAGLDAATAAALGAFRHPAYSAAAHLGYPPVSLGLSLASYQQALSAASYGRLAKNPADPMSVCRDPYCTGCPSSSVLAASQSAHAAVTSSSSSPVTSSSANSCPAGCNQCDHIRTTASSSLAAGSSVTSSAQSSHLSTVSSVPSTIVTSTASPDSAASIASRPYVCNWIAADHYCGKRFTSSEELLQHLRTHTSLSVPTAVPASSEPLSSPLGSSNYSPLLNPSLHPHSHLLAASSALHRTYPTPPLSPLSMARYHPYSKAPTSASPLSAAAAASIAPPPPPNPLLSLHHPYAGLGAYYSTHPYSLYSQRMLAGAGGVLP